MFTAKASITIAQVKQIVIAKYGDPEHDFAQNDSLARLSSAFGGDLSKCRGMRILDLGCGAEAGAEPLRIEMRDKLAAQIQRLLKPGGVLIAFDQDLHGY